MPISRVQLFDQQDNIGRFSRFDPWAAPVLYVHCPGQNIDQHQFADDTQLYTVIDSASPHCFTSLTACVDAVTDWHIWNDLLLNSSKTEALVAGIRHQVAKLNTSTVIAVFGSIVPFPSKLRALGATLDEELTFDDISGIVRACTTIYAPYVMYVRSSTRTPLASLRVR